MPTKPIIMEDTTEKEESIIQQIVDHIKAEPKNENVHKTSDCRSYE